MSAKCTCCGDSLPPGAARLVVGERWLCPTCVYRSEHGDLPAPKQPSPARRGAPPKQPSPARRGAPQEERLFPLEPYTRRKE